jgi:hypothetical protein
MIMQHVPSLWGQEGIENVKLDKLPVGQNFGRYRVSYTLLLEFSLSSQSLFATAPTINIELIWLDCFLPFLMVGLLLFP